MMCVCARVCVCMCVCVHVFVSLFMEICASHVLSDFLATIVLLIQIENH